MGSLGGGSSSGGGPSGGLGGMNSYAMERQNDDQVDMLTSKMGLLKEISLQIGEEVNAQNRYLQDLSNDFTTSGSLLNTTMGKLTKMAKNQSSRWMCYLVLFVIAVFSWLFLFRRSH
ncbi:hypothetical protein CXG81DRAFT_12808 [Caulochytrium protostelioides]|uniref:t-SNARE coiled-coil homology domain-containing protein n=1 Tax=Caulochytrium protostelioides TaxID=1555241 RepID=A0A4P9X6H7_9FUNG|nr:hypothetical protein CXG81DRAFT_12808 [Caulochytrium protostelioides]|eukprot:RKP00796.1 hypothetical protein CXG81DRAFT_12808 [Caulochytrium protostelioides]